MANVATEMSARSSSGLADFKAKVPPPEQHLALEKVAHTAGEKVGSMASELARKTSETVQSSREYVKENPGKGVAIAAAVGVVAGSLLTMALRKRRE